MLIINDLKTAMLNATVNLTDSSTAMTALGNSISTYIKNNLSMTFTWIAFSPAPAPDPVTVANGGLSTLTVTLTPSGADNQSTALSFLQTQIIAGFNISTYNITDAGFITSLGVLGTAPLIGTLSISISANDRDTAFNMLATSIITWILTLIPLTPCIGSHGIYVGTGTPVSVS